MTSEKFRCLDDEEGKQADMLKRNNYFMTSGDKIRFFFDPLAYNANDELVDGTCYYVFQSIILQ